MPQHDIDLDPNKDKLAQYIQDIALRVGNLEASRQPYIGDWIELNPQVFVFNSVSGNTGFIDMTNSNYAPFFSVGTRIYYEQGGTRKYGFITRVLTNQIRISGGKNNVLANQTITKFAFSKIDAPSGMPIPMPFDLVFSSDVITFPSDISNYNNSTYTMSGRNVKVFLDFAQVLGGSASAVMYFNLPTVWKYNEMVVNTSFFPQTSWAYVSPPVSSTAQYYSQVQTASNVNTDVFGSIFYAGGSITPSFGGQIVVKSTFEYTIYA